MGSEKTPLLSTAEDSMWNENNAVPMTRAFASKSASGGLQETARSESGNIEAPQLPLLMPLKTQFLYWTASASVVACGQAIRRVVVQHYVVGPILFIFVVACLVPIVIMDTRGRPWSTTLTSRMFIIGLAMLLSSDMFWPLLCLINDWVSRNSTTPLTSPQDHAVRFCFAYTALEFHDCRTRIGSHVIIPDNTSRASVWREPPYFTHLQVPGPGQPVWKRRDKVRGVCHGVLAWCITFVLARLIACVLSVPSTAVWLQLWGAGCLGGTHVPLGIFLLRPVHALVLWLCDQTLHALGRLVDCWRGIWEDLREGTFMTTIC